MSDIFVSKKFSLENYSVIKKESPFEFVATFCVYTAQPFLIVSVFSTLGKISMQSKLYSVFLHRMLVKGYINKLCEIFGQKEIFLNQQ